MKPVKLGLLGVGTVGASTAMVLKNNAAEIARRAGRSIEIIQASRRSLEAGLPEGCDNIELVADPFTVVNNKDVDIVIERHGKATAAVISYETYQALQPALAEIRASASVRQRGQKMAAVLEELAQLPESDPIQDPVAWQREQRQDRALPGRDD